MRFMIMMHMPQRTASSDNPGSFVHQLFVEHQARDLSEFIDCLVTDEFVIVKELYKDPEANRRSGNEIALNYRYIAKIKQMDNGDNDGPQRYPNTIRKYSKQTR